MLFVKKFNHMGIDMTTLREAAQQALEFIRWSQYVPCQSEAFPEPPSTAPQVEAALKAALAEPVQEPVAWRYKKEGGGWFVSDNEPQYVEQWNDIEEIQPLYTAPPQRPSEPVQEPVAWFYQNMYTEQEYLVWKKGTGGRNWRPLYTAPPQRKPLTEEEIREMFFAELRTLPSYPSAIEELPERLARAIERAYGIMP